MNEVPKNDSTKAVTAADGEEFLENVLGFNFRSLRTIWVTFINPKIYFEAAKSADWQGRFTPSIRLLLALSAIMIATQFIWLRPAGALIEGIHDDYVRGFSAGLAASGLEADLSGIDVRPQLIEAVKKSFVFSTPLGILFTCLFAWAYRIWGTPTSFIIRLRWVFALSIPATVFSVIWTLLISAITVQAVYDKLSYASIAVIFGLMFLTAFRGAYADMKKAKRWGYAFLLSSGVLLMTVIAQTIALWISVNFFSNQSMIEAFTTYINSTQ